MKKIYFLTLIFASQFTWATILKHNKQTSLGITLKEKKVQIELPQAAYEALNKWNAEFTVFDRSDFPPSILRLLDEEKLQPMTFIGDIEGTGKKGIVLFGQDSKTQYVVALVPRAKGWKAIEVYSTIIPNIKKSDVPNLEDGKETGVPYYILPAQGKHAELLKKKIGIQVETFMGPGAVYEIKKDKSVQFVLE